MNKLNLLINVSEIAIITGDNNFKSKREYLIDVWKKNEKDDYNKYIKLTNFSKETDEIKIKNISLKNNINIEDEIKKCSFTNNINDMDKLKKQIFSKVENLSEADKNEITKSITNVTNTKFGIKNEFDVCKLYENLTKSSIIKDNKYKIKKIFDTDQFSVSIGGKIDGINLKTGSVIEIKNRMHKLFYKLRDYEKVQIMAYLYLHESENGHLVEAFKKKEGVDINIIDVPYDDIYINNILDKIKLFSISYFNFIQNHDAKIELLKNNIEIDFLKF